METLRQIVIVLLELATNNPMTPQQTQEVKEKIIEAVPEIMELKFGCRVFIEQCIWKSNVDGYDAFGTVIRKIENTDYKQLDVSLDDYDGDILNVWENDGYDFKVLGRPIQLADVLRAINAKDGNGEFYCIDAQGDFGEPTPEGVAMFGVKWDLSKDFDGQSDETKTFIYNILIKKL